MKRVGETNGYVAPGAFPEKKGCGYACMRICELICSVLGYKERTGVHPYAAPALDANRVRVRKKSDDPIENMLNVKVVESGIEKSDNALSGSGRTEGARSTGDV